MHRTVPILSLALLLCHALHVVPAESNEPNHEPQGHTLNGARESGRLQTGASTDSHADRLASTGLVPYRVEPPDILRVTVFTPQGEQTREALVGPDGRINLGEMGYLDVVGKEIEEISLLVSARFAQKGSQDRVAVDLFAYNSKAYYIIRESATAGSHVHRFPVTGNETVLDALAQVGDWHDLGSKELWVSRPNAGRGTSNSILSIDWRALQRGDAATNHPLYPGDRLFVAEKAPHEESVSLDPTHPGNNSASGRSTSKSATLQVDLEWKLLELTVAHSKSMSLDTLIPSHADKTPVDETPVDKGLSDVCVLDQPTLDALVKQLPNHGSIKTIASSQTVTVSGGTTSATFGDSMELLIPPGAEGGDANRTVQRMQLGTMLEITPTWLAEDGVRIDFRLRTRHANSSTSVVVNDQRIPGLSTSFIARSVSVKGSDNVVALLRTAQTAADSDQPATYLLAIMQAAVPNNRTEPDVP